MQFDSLDKQSLTTKVYRHVRDDILEGKYRIGDFLIETKLAEELDVSRTPIREALKQLELEDLVVSVPNRGVMVQGISDHDIDDIFTIRYLLEGQAAYWSAERIGEDHLSQLSELVDLMELYTRKNDPVKLSILDSDFHEIIFASCNSRVLKHILGSLHQNAQRARRSSLGVPERPHKSFEEHRAIFIAIQEHRAADAKALMEAHVANVLHNGESE
ncbi:MAG: GntR family transcriptional regulator [Clostridia bacterium]